MGGRKVDARADEAQSARAVRAVVHRLFPRLVSGAERRVQGRVVDNSSCMPSYGGEYLFLDLLGLAAMVGDQQQRAAGLCGDRAGCGCRVDATGEQRHLLCAPVSAYRQLRERCEGDAWADLQVPNVAAEVPQQ